MNTLIKTEIDFYKKEIDLCELSKELWRRYFIGTKQEVKEFLDAIDSSCIIIGTGKDEFYDNKELICAEVTKAIEEREKIKFSLKRFWAKEYIVCDNIRLVYGKIDTVGNIANGRTIFNMDSQFSIMYKYTGNQWKIIYIIESIPNEDKIFGEHFPHILAGQIEKAWEHADRMTELAQEDKLTGLMNRRAFDTMLQKFQNLSGIVASIYVDLDNFKEVNDTFGHDAGDMVIMKVSEILKRIFRKDDNVARIGGDEFCAFFEIGTTDYTIIKKIACEKIERLLKETPIIVCHGLNEIHVTFSIGLCIHTIGDKMKPTEILKIADNAMYEIKKSNKNGACIYLENTLKLKFNGMDFQSKGCRLVLTNDENNN